MSQLRDLVLRYLKEKPEIHHFISGAVFATSAIAEAGVPSGQKTPSLTPKHR
jgi:hypothetical protein